jgi:hypothetical protein
MDVDALDPAAGEDATYPPRLQHNPTQVCDTKVLFPAERDDEVVLVMSTLWSQSGKTPHAPTFTTTTTTQV